MQTSVVATISVGFLKKLGALLTTLCLGHLTYKINTEFKKGLFTGIILMDLQKKALDALTIKFYY